MHVCFAWGIGGGEMLLIMAAILVLFGSKRIPEFAKGLGHAMREFNKAKNELTYELHNAVEERPHYDAVTESHDKMIELPDKTHELPASSMNDSTSTENPAPGTATDPAPTAPIHPPATVPKT
jgi:sec-independent protein translocase protein TatA